MDVMVLARKSSTQCGVVGGMMDYVGFQRAGFVSLTGGVELVKPLLKCHLPWKACLGHYTPVLT